jgi:putative tryptophan/tyrosine transport system substrate-binding protein
MRRREFIVALGGAVAWPLGAHGKQAARVYRLGFLTTRSGPAAIHGVLVTTLAELGYHETQNLMIERHYADGLDRLPALAAELVRTQIDVIVTETTPAALAAKQATNTIPIVMATGGEAVTSGVVASLARPGGNVTGMSFLGPQTVGKRLDFMRELRPDIKRIAFLGNWAIVPEQLSFGELQTHAAEAGIETAFVDVRAPQDLARAFANMAETATDAVYVAPSAAFTELRERIVGLATSHKLLAMYGRREFADAGGLISYGVSFDDLFRRAAVFVDKILRGSKPSELPVEQPTKFDLVINLKAANALGVSVPPLLLARADEVIE